MSRNRLFGLVILVLSFTAASTVCEATTTIDFETPPLGGNSWQIIDPYVASGVAFTALDAPYWDAVVGIVKESVLGYPCSDPQGQNQMLGTGDAAGGAPIGSEGHFIRADFSPDPENPVLMVAAEIQATTFTLGYGELLLFDSTDSVIGGGYVPSCGTISGTATERVAYAIIAVYAPGVSCEPEIRCPFFTIDNFTFGSPPTSTEAATWGAVKALYR